MADRYEVIIIGAGTTGAAAAYHLAEAGVTDLLCMEMGTPGQGRSRHGGVPAGTPLRTGDEANYVPHNSGSSVFDDASSGPPTIKMIVTLPPYLMLDGFADHHGWDGVKTYLEVAARGRDLEIALASTLLPSPSEQIKAYGSLMVCEPDRVERLRREFELLQQMGCDCDWWGRDAVVAAHGEAANFVAGIWFGGDARIDSSTYSRALLQSAASSGALTIREDCAPMVRITTVNDRVEVLLADGETVFCRKALVATGGMFIDEHLAGILTPRYSYLAALPHRDPHPAVGMAAPDSPNFFTFGFSHDWCVEDGFVRISGEDHFSALKSPRATERCGRLANWCLERYPYLDARAGYGARYGVYSETADFMPLVGTPSESSRVCYLVGCNAWGQASLSAAAAMAPALLGYREFQPHEEAAARLFSLRRFTGQAVVDSARVDFTGPPGRRPTER